MVKQFEGSSGSAEESSSNLKQTRILITKPDLKKLDGICHKYVKHGAGFPPCATKSIFHLKNALDIPSVTPVYEEAHFVNHTDARLKNDNTVDHSLDSRYNREKD